MTDHAYQTADGSTWSSLPPKPTKMRKTESGGFQPPKTQTPGTSHVENPIDAFLLFVSEETMIRKMVENTNLEGRRVCKAKWVETDQCEMRALLGSLLLLGSLKQGMLDTTTVWDPYYGNPMVRAALARQRFIQLLSHLRFDDKESRSERRANDAFASFRDVWDAFVANLQRYYVPGPFLTIDEQVVPFHGRCSFLQYTPNKGERYGLKMFWVVDCDNGYPVYGIPYLGHSAEGLENLGREVVLQLASPFIATGRNITLSHFLADLELVELLRKMGLTCVGNVCQNKTFLPEWFQRKKLLPPHQCELAYRPGVTLCYHQTNKQNSCVVVSSMLHDNGALDNTPSSHNKQTPDVVKFYNSTKWAVSSMDKAARTFSTRRKTQRWPTAMFFNVLDLAALAARCVFEKNCPDHPLARDHARGKFLRSVAESLIAGHLQCRSRNIYLSASLKLTIADAIAKVSGKPGQPTGVAPKGLGQRSPEIHTLSPDKEKSESVKRKQTGDEGEEEAPGPTEAKRRDPHGRCKGGCDWRADRKTSSKCQICHVFICKQHTYKTCKNCLLRFQFQPPT
jgi:hypothetical protein